MDPDIRDLSGRSLLCYYIEERRLREVQILMRHGADPDVKGTGEDKQTPAELANALGLVEFQQALRPVSNDW